MKLGGVEGGSGRKISIHKECEVYRFKFFWLKKKYTGYQIIATQVRIPALWTWTCLALTVEGTKETLQEAVPLAHFLASLSPSSWMWTASPETALWLSFFGKQSMWQLQLWLFSAQKQRHGATSCLA